MRLGQLLPLLDRLAPLAHSEPWDNTGLLLGHPDDAIAQVWLAIDLTYAVLAEARAAGAQLIIAYHPPWFGKKSRLVGDELLLAAARAGLAIYSPHTALDAAPGGTNDVLADAADVASEGRLALQPITGAAAGVGMGRVGPRVGDGPWSSWLAQLKARMGVAHALVACPPGPAAPLPAQALVAVCAGAGDGLLDAALRARAQVFVVGEMRHHHALRAVAQGVRVVALTHSNSERAALRPYAAALAILAPALTLGVSEVDVDPYTFA